MECAELSCNMRWPMTARIHNAECNVARLRHAHVESSSRTNSAMAAVATHHLLPDMQTSLMHIAEAWPGRDR